MALSFLYYFKMYLAQLKKEMEDYSDEASIWLAPKGVNNSAGNLCSHLIGNLNHYVGHVIGGTDYVRNRTEEFSVKGIPRAQLLAAIDDTIVMLEQVLHSDLDLSQAYPKGHFSFDAKDYHFTLMRLVGHLSYHVGQISYHRRLLNMNLKK